jgi:hypothetical protein
MPTLTARDLQKTDPKRFQKEYLKWTEYAVEYDWWEWTEDRLKETLAPAGVRVDKLWFSLSYSQGDYATFEGHIMVWEWMEATKDGDQTYADKYPALHLALADYGEDATVTTYNRSCGARANLDGNVVGNTYPTGIFAGLDQDAWDALVEEQFYEAGLEQALQDYVDAISAELYTDLREEYEHLTSEESFIESCECNDITFEIEECEA